MEKCHAVTRFNTPCNYIAKTMINSFGVNLPVCKRHCKRNVLYDWSCVDEIEEAPEKVLNYLHFYNVCLTLFNEYVSVYFSKKFFENNISQAQLMENYNCIFQKTETLEACPICYEKANIKIQCGHYFCNTCISAWTDSCPMCRQFIFPT